VSADKNFGNNLKGNHFGFAHTDKKDPNHYVSNHQDAFQDHVAAQGGDASRFRGQLNENRKADLRRNHFDFGIPVWQALSKARCRDSTKCQ